jgi:hypothetical protein
VLLLPPPCSAIRVCRPTIVAQVSLIAALSLDRIAGSVTRRHVIKHGAMEAKIKVCKIFGIEQPLHVSLVSFSVTAASPEE